MTRTGSKLRFSKIDVDSLLSGGLSAFLVFLYVCVIYVAVVAIGVAPLGDMRDPDFFPPWWLNLLALALIAVTFVPVMRWVRTRVNDLVYAEHDDAWVKIGRITQPLELMSSPQHSLQRIVETIAAELHLPHVSVELRVADPPLRAACGTPPARAEIASLPITDLDSTLGSLEASGRAAGRPLSASDLVLLRDVARQIGVAFHAMWLAASLQTARERLVLAREEERRRIRNDLHDGLGPTLASLQLQMGTARALLQQDPQQAERLLDELRGDLRMATAEIRRLVYDLRPPLLDDLGLVAAIRNLRLNGSDLHFEVDAPESMPRLPAAVEVAAYRIASEAVQNVVTHAHARRCLVTLAAAEGRLRLSICDDGAGIGAEYLPGVGLRSMRERASELGGELTIKSRPDGGTEIIATLPLAVEP